MVTNFPRLFGKPLQALFGGISTRVILSVKSSSKNSSETKETAKMPSVNGSLVLKYTKVIPEAYPPTKGSVKAAGYDLKSACDVTVPARGKALVDTGIKIQLPEGCYGRIAPRSGLAVKNFIDVGAGVVDEDYRGVLKVVLFNHSDADFEVKSGDRIAQLICERIYYPDIEEVQELTDTDRGEGGFGSTGTN
ncbi:deoxyuridine 5'-triphosphate nucleotidohydrolase [Anoplophora glabripennis]|uniref:deoxyuridine 5'-triphosphate nucleotidohydrolase n=1 Tax=Anoplophora glabripennis TaxID=217634 RepID=UPI0008756994|nr:deoxyuridine 5'-triphosphate nucleotidohydrolase [Anoplophora glabripennis]